MRLASLITGLSGAAVAVAEVPSSLFLNNHDSPDVVSHKIPTSYESAVMGRRILALSKLADLSTVFPGSHPNSNSESSSDSDSDEHAAAHAKPSGLSGVPIGLMDYVADCEGDEGNPTLLAIKIATSFRNVEAGSNLTLSLRWIPPYPPSKRISFFSRLSAYIPFLSGVGDSPYSNSASDSTPDPVPYSAANLPRFSLFGYLEPIHPSAVESVKLAGCFTSKHQDAKWWLPGNPIHQSSWARLVVTNVYWIGGFGDRAYIGWIPVEEWKNVTKEEWQGITLPGEKSGWSEWSVNMFDEL